VIPADDQLVAVLAKIAEIEGREGYEGPKISDIERYIYELEYRSEGQLPPEWKNDIIVGEIGRACDARGWALKIDGSYGDEALAEDRVIAAASAYLKAIGGGDRG
jgi:hypothetical protein